LGAGAGFTLDLPDIFLPSPPDAKCNELFTVPHFSEARHSDADSFLFHPTE
jgi:hypothetical protein